MTFPINVGLPQVIEFIVALIGLVLLISAIRSLLPHRSYPSEDEKEEYRRSGRWPRRRWYRRRFRWEHGLGGIILLVVAVSLLWLTFLVQSYLGYTSDIKVAEVKAHMISNVPHQMDLELILYNQDGRVTSDQYYSVLGDEWMLQADFIKFPPWMNILGFHAGYKLTRLEGSYQDANLERNSKHTVVELNGGEDNFFKTMQSNRQWFSPFVDAYYGNAVFEPGNGTFDVYASQTGLYAKQTSNIPAGFLTLAIFYPLMPLVDPPSQYLTKID
ncbi:MAG TPA: hypothetical protein VKV20_10590 [Ktedonobacteraceae bacterium]|nr:hypothetical protein [Ktedonobacteraceae bacterium]